MNDLIVCGFDVDHTMIDYPEIDFLVYCENRGCAVNYEAFNSTHSWKYVDPVSYSTYSEKSKRRSQLFHDFIHSNAHLQRAIPGAHEVLMTLQNMHGCEHHFATARVKTTKEITITTINELFLGVSFISKEFTGLANKGVIARKKGFNFFTDDNACEIHDVLEHSPNTTCLQFPSFRGNEVPLIDHPKVIRLNACDQVTKDPSNEHMEEVWLSAWQQIAEVIMNSAPVVATA